MRGRLGILIWYWECIDGVELRIYDMGLLWPSLQDIYLQLTYGALYFAPIWKYFHARPESIIVD